MNHKKYRPFPPVVIENRKWPSNTITKAPIWCSVDLRDGNQSLEIPMNLEQKLEFFNYLIKMGFKEIEVGFPSASETEFDFVRALIERNLIPDDVIIQVLVQCREHLILKTFESLRGVKKAIVHIYNSTSTLQRAVVFNMNMDEIKEIATNGAKLVQKLANEQGREHFIFEYTPESFNSTELFYAAEICNDVLDIWEPTPQNKAIINLPTTVEMATANIYADQIEYMCNNIKRKDSVIISIHAHNDRGTGVASSELALLAGAERVEGTLFGNGERTGNADILNLAMNMYTQGIDPLLDFSNIDELVALYEKTTNLLVNQRHPYAGNLVYTAFSGSHQDAIKKGMAKMKEHPERWEIPYLPVDPMDVGRNYDPIIRINSQSGKGGVAFILEKSYGLQIPKKFQQHFSTKVTHASDSQNKELSAENIYDLFNKEYVNIEEPASLLNYKEESNGEIKVRASILVNGNEKIISGNGNGLVDAFCKGLIIGIGKEFEVLNYSEHSLEYSSKSRAITYIEITDSKGQHYFGAGVSGSISKSSLKAIISAVNKMLLGN